MYKKKTHDVPKKSHFFHQKKPQPKKTPFCTKTTPPFLTKKNPNLYHPIITPKNPTENKIDAQNPFLTKNTPILPSPRPKLLRKCPPISYQKNPISYQKKTIFYQLKPQTPHFLPKKNPIPDQDCLDDPATPSTHTLIEQQTQNTKTRKRCTHGSESSSNCCCMDVSVCTQVDPLFSRHLVHPYYLCCITPICYIMTKVLHLKRAKKIEKSIVADLRALMTTTTNQACSFVLSAKACAFWLSVDQTCKPQASLHVRFCKFSTYHRTSLGRTSTYHHSPQEPETASSRF